MGKKKKEVRKVYGVNEDSESFGSYRANARRVVRDIYGTGTTNCNLMLEKINSCTTIPQINNVLVWGRKNLL